MGEDRQWQQRIRLSDRLLLETVDWWCRTDSEFPFDETIASVLRLFSSRCNPFAVSETRIRPLLFGLVGTPMVECSKTWPKRDDAEKVELIGAISRILSEAVRQWNDGPAEPSIDSVNRQIVGQLTYHKYVVFHHNETASRDYGGFHGSG
jgi:hypothetical protein